MAGLTLTGFDMPTVGELAESLRERARVKFGAGVNVDPDSPLGQLFDLIADALHTCWSGGRAAYDAQNPNAAEGILLDNIGAINLIPRKGASKSTGQGTMIGVAGTDVPVGTFLLAPSGPRVVTSAALELTGGSDLVSLEAAETGVIELVGVLTFNIMNPVAGLSTATLEAGQEVSGGRAIETNPDYRDRREASLQLNSGATDPSIRAAILAVDTVTDAVVISNRRNVTWHSIPPGMYQPFVLPVTVPVEDIAAAIVGSAAAGKGSFGTEEVLITDSMGYEDEFYFSWGAEIPINIAVDVAVDGRYYDGDAALEAVLNAYILGLKMGEDVSYDYVRGVVAMTTGVQVINTCTVNGGGGPVAVDVYAGQIADRTPTVSVTS